jgi:ribosomal protein S18 acetylase RimI-like enzyme
MKIEKLHKTHLEAYVKFRKNSSKDSVWVNPFNETKALNLINSYDADADKAGFVILNEGEIIGQLLLRIKTESNICYIQLISVLKKYYGKGVADKLIDKAISFAKEHKVKGVELTVATNNKRAISFYKKKKFVHDRDYAKGAQIYYFSLEAFATETYSPSINRLLTW